MFEYKVNKRKYADPKLSVQEALESARSTPEAMDATKESPVQICVYDKNQAESLVYYELRGVV